MSSNLHSLLIAASILLFTAHPIFADPPPVQVKIDFGSTAMFQDSNGADHTGVPSGLSDQTKAAIIIKAQKKFDDALGPGKVVISEGTGGDIDVIMSGEDYSRSYGNTGMPCEPAVVYTETFRLAKDSMGNPLYSAGMPFQNAVSETLAHEIAHKLGVAHNQETSPYTIMTEGNLVPPSARAADGRQFTANDARVMNMNFINPCNGPKLNAFGESSPAGTEQAESANPQLLGDDEAFDAHLSITGPTGAEAGYITDTNSFAFQGDTTTPDQFMTFDYTAPLDLAIRLQDGTIISMEDAGADTLQFLNQNPNVTDHAVYDTLELNFNTPQGPATITLDTATDPDSRSGFVSLPEPAMTFVVPAALLVARRKTRITTY